jgi:flagellar motility protein MotE (MotC chaperone)
MKIISIMDAENKQQSTQVKADIEEAMLVLDAKIDSVRRALARVDERVKVLEEKGGEVPQVNA